MNNEIQTLPTTNELSVEYRDWVRSQGLSLGSADEHFNDEAISQDQRNWLREFCDRWDQTLLGQCTEGQQEPRHSDTLFDVYVPATENTFNIDPASAILAGISQRGNEMLTLYYEGNPHNLQNISTFAHLCLYAAGRACMRYPTAAQTTLPATKVMRVGTFDSAISTLVELVEPQALEAWLGNRAAKMGGG